MSSKQQLHQDSTYSGIIARAVQHTVTTPLSGRTRIWFTLKKTKSMFERTDILDFKYVGTTDLATTTAQVTKEYPGYEVINREIFIKEGGE